MYKYILKCKTRSKKKKNVQAIRIAFAITKYCRQLATVTYKYSPPV